MIMTPLVGPETIEVRCRPETPFDRAVLKILGDVCGLREVPTADGNVFAIELRTRFDAAQKPAPPSNGADRTDHAQAQVPAGQAQKAKGA